MGRSRTTGRKTESMNDRWFPAKMTPPDLGMFSLPITHGRNTVSNSGPTNRFFKSQYSIPNASQTSQRSASRVVRGEGLALGVDSGQVGGADDSRVVDELGNGELRLRVKS